MKMTHEGVVSLDALVLPVDPFLQRDGDATDATAVADCVTMMEAQPMAQDVDVMDVAVADVENEAILMLVMPS